MLQQSIFHSRRFNSRVETHEGVWVDWRCAGVKTFHEFAI